jgi:L-ascorbate metabolism protein UlaG (beta-lactamase superfamily)
LKKLETAAIIAGMVIQYFGDECFRLQSGELSVLVNPSSNRLKADIVLKTLAETDAIPEPGEFIFPGEYESKDIEIQGFQLDEESTEKYVKTVYLVRFEDMKFVFMGHIAKPLNSNTDWIDSISEPDFLFLPTGDSHFIEAAEAAKLAKKLEPAFIIPSYRGKPDDFLKAMGSKVEPQEKLVIKKKEIGEKKDQVVVLEPK